MAKGKRFVNSRGNLASLLPGGQSQTQGQQQTGASNTSGQQSSGGVFLPGITDNAQLKANNEIERSNRYLESIEEGRISSNVVLPGINDKSRFVSNMDATTLEQKLRANVRAENNNVDRKSSYEKIQDELNSPYKVLGQLDNVIGTYVKTPINNYKKFLTRAIWDSGLTQNFVKKKLKKEGINLSDDTMDSISKVGEKIIVAYTDEINNNFKKLEEKNLNPRFKEKYDNENISDLIGKGDFAGALYKMTKGTAENWQMIPEMGLTIALPPVGLTVMGMDVYVQENQGTFEDMMNNGASYEEARNGAIIVGILNSGIELLMERFLGGVQRAGATAFRRLFLKETQREIVRNATKKGFAEIIGRGLSGIVKGSLVEGFEEVLQQIVGNVMVSLFNPNRKWSEGTRESFEGGFFNLFNIFGGAGSVIEDYQNNKKVDLQTDIEALNYVMEGEERKAQRMQQAKERMKQRFLNPTMDNGYTPSEEQAEQRANEREENEEFEDEMKRENQEGPNYTEEDEQRFTREGIEEQQQADELRSRQNEEVTLENEMAKEALSENINEDLGDPRYQKIDEDLQDIKNSIDNMDDNTFFNRIMSSINKGNKNYVVTTDNNGNKSVLRVVERGGNTKGSNGKTITVQVMKPSKKSGNVSVSEFTYTPGNLTTDQKQGIITGFENWGKTGNFSDNTSSNQKYQLKYEEKGYNPGVAGKNEKSISGKEGVNQKNKINDETIEQLANKYGVRIDVIKGLIKVLKDGKWNGKDYAYGKYLDQVLTLSEQIKDSTAPHELLHAIFDMIDPETKAYLISQVMKSEGWSAKKAEEWLADSFSNFFRTGKIESAPKSTRGKIKIFFKRVRSFINGLGRWRSELEEIFTDIITAEDIEDLQGRIDRSEKLNEAKARMKKRFMEYAKNAEKMQKKAEENEGKYQKKQKDTPRPLTDIESVRTRDVSLPNSIVINDKNANKNWEKTEKYQIADESLFRKASDLRISQMERRIIEEYGTTDNPSRVAFIDNKGNWINGNMGGYGNYRDVDHREIAQTAFDDTDIEFTNGTEGLNALQAQTGMVRVNYNDGYMNIDTVYPLNWSQEESIMRFEDDNIREVYLDITDAKTGRVLDGGTFSSVEEAIRYINNYFNDNDDIRYQTVDDIDPNIQSPNQMTRKRGRLSVIDKFISEKQKEKALDVSKDLLVNEGRFEGLPYMWIHTNKYNSRIIPNFDNVKDSRYKEFTDLGKIVAFFTNNEDMSKSYADQKSVLANTKKFNSIKEFNDKFNKDTSDRHISEISGNPIKGDTFYVIEKDENDYVLHKKYDELIKYKSIDDMYKGTMPRDVVEGLNDSEKIQAVKKYAKDNFMGDEWGDSRYDGVEIIRDGNDVIFRLRQDKELGRYKTEKEALANARSLINKEGYYHYKGIIQNVYNPLVVDEKNYGNTTPYWNSLGNAYEALMSTPKAKKGLAKINKKMNDLQEGYDEIYRDLSDMWEAKKKLQEERGNAVDKIEAGKPETAKEAQRLKDLITDNTAGRKKIQNFFHDGGELQELTPDEAKSKLLDGRTAKDIWDKAKKIYDKNKDFFDAIKRPKNALYEFDYMGYTNIQRENFKDYILKLGGFDEGDKSLFHNINFGDGHDFFWDESIDNKLKDKTLTTNDWVFYALKKGGYDGVLFKNIIDYGGKSIEGNVGGDVIAVFNSNNFKSWDNADPTDSKYISYQKMDSDEKNSDGKKLSNGQAEYFKNSKVRDENGNLLVVYHGTQAGNFTVYMHGKNGISNSLAKVGYRFTPNKQGALNFAKESLRGRSKPRADKVYLNITNPKIYEPRKIDLMSEEEKKVELDKEWDVYKEKKQKADAIDYTKAYGFFHDEYDHPIEERHLFATLSSQYEYAEKYNGKLGKYDPESMRWYSDKYGLDHDKIVKDVEEYERLKKEADEEYNKYLEMKISDPYDDFMYDIYKIDSNMDTKWTRKDLNMALNNYESPNKFREKLISEGYDGIIIKQTAYDGSVIGGGARNDQYVAFYSNQIKRTTNKNPTDNEDIRYQETEDNEGRALTVGQAEYFKDSKARVDESLDKPIVRVYHTTTNMIIPFTEFNPVGTDGYRFRDQVVNYYTDDEDMSGSYADQNYKKYEGKANLYTRADVNKFIKEINEGNYEDRITGERIKLKIHKIKKGKGYYNQGKQYHLYQEWDMDKIKKMEEVLNSFGKSDKKLLNGVFKYGSIRDYIENDTNIKYWDGERESGEEKKLINKYHDIWNKLNYKMADAGFDSASDLSDYYVYKKQPEGKSTYATYRDEHDLIRNIESDIEYMINGMSNWQYDGYVNITNPYIIDAEGRNWNTVRVGRFLVKDILTDWNEKSDAEKKKILKVVKDAKKEYEEGVENEGRDWRGYYGYNGELENVIRDTMGSAISLEINASSDYYGSNLVSDIVDIMLGGMKEEELQSFVSNNLDNVDSDTTNDIVWDVINSNKEGKTNYDGIIIKNVIDYGGKSDKKEGAHNVYVTFASNQFKSVYNENPTEDADIRYQIAEYDYDENGKRTNLKFGEDNGERDPSIFGEPTRKDIIEQDKENEKNNSFYDAWRFYNDQNFEDDWLTFNEFIEGILKWGEKQQAEYDQKMNDLSQAQNNPKMLELQLRAVKLMEEEGNVGKKFGKNVSKEVRERQQAEVEKKREDLIKDIFDWMYPGLRFEDATYDDQMRADEIEAEWEMMGREGIEEKLKYFKKDKNGNWEAKNIKIESPEEKWNKLVKSNNFDEVFTPVDRVLEWSTPQGQKGRIDRAKDPKKYKSVLEKINRGTTKTKVTLKDVTQEVRALEKYRAEQEAEKERKKKEKQEAMAKKKQEDYKRMVRMKAFQRLVDMQRFEKYPFLTEDEIKTRYGFTDDEWKTITEQEEIKLPKKWSERAVSDFNKAVDSQVKDLIEGLNWQNTMKRKDAEKNLGEIGDIDIDVLLGKDEEKGAKEVEEFEKLAEEKDEDRTNKRLKDARDNIVDVEIDTERENSKSEREKIDKLIKSTKSDKTVWGSIKEFTSNILTPVSTKIKDISPKVYREVMRYFQNKDIKTNERLKTADPFLKAMRKIRKENPVRFMDIWVNLANRNIGYANGLLKEYGVTVPTELLDTIYDEAQDVGLNINYLGNYFPLSVKAPRKFLEELMKVNEKDIASEIEKKIMEESQKKGGPLEEAEITAIINDVIAGEDKGPDVNVGNAHLKKRNTEIKRTAKMLEYCDDPISTLISYIEGMTQSIERAKFLGKSRSGNVHTLADYVYNAKNGLNPEQQDELMDLLKAVFNDANPSKAIQTWRDLATLTTLGSPSSTLTQLGDLSFSVYENGWRETLKAVWDVFMKRKAFDLIDMGVLNRGEEYANINSRKNLLQKAIHNVFKLTFFSTFDTFGKSTFIQSTWNKWTRLARKDDKQLRKDIMKWTDDDYMTDKIINDLKNNNFSEDVALVMYMKLGNIQPLTRAQMPKAYLNNPNGRLFYQFKTFGIKQLDYVLQETKNQTKNFKNLSTGEKLLRILQIANMVMIMTLLGVGADELKDLTMRRRSNSLILRWLFGDGVGSEQVWEKIEDNVLKLFGLSRYTVMQMKSDPVDAIASLFTSLPATNLIIYPFKDIRNAFKDDGSIDRRNPSAYQLIPIIGKYRYWIYGGGQDKQQESLGKKKKKSGSGSGPRSRA